MAIKTIIASRETLEKMCKINMENPCGMNSNCSQKYVGCDHAKAI